MDTNPITDQELSGLMEEWEKILKCGKETLTEFLKVMIQKTQTLSEPHQFFSRVERVAISISSIPGYLLKKYQSEQQMPEDERYWLPSEIYGCVERALDILLQDESLLAAVATNPPVKPKSLHDLSIWKLILWSAELWFTKKLQTCQHVPVKDWIKKRGVEIFEKFFGPLELENDSRFKLLAENNAIDIVEELLSPKSSVKEALEKHLGKKENVCQFNKISTSKSMMLLVNKSSKKYYIIPRPSKMRNHSIMYGIHAYGFLMNDQAGFSQEEQRAEESMLRGLSNAGVEVITLPPDSEIFASGNKTFGKLTEWLLGKLYDIRDRCSILFLSMMCHGSAGHVSHSYQDPDSTEPITIQKKIEEFLKLVNHSVLELEGIPKVIAIEACQGCEVPPKESLRDTINNYPDTMLLMSCEEGQDHYPSEFPGYLENLAKSIGSADRSTTVQNMHGQAAVNYVEDQRPVRERLGCDEYIPKSAIHIAEGMRGVMLPSVPGTSPADSNDKHAADQTDSDTEY